ncbi:MGMT family protein [Dehalobacter sp. DCM]|uniref:MGMT family protein n=1 Tax=Dehalobacter sp. DCM TaxID=2907827 RepID=UPI0030812D1A|nr:MGMT family protein [Dehalobacter sp. DCM]
MAKKTYNEKLHNVKNLPRIEFIGYDEKMAKRFGSGYMLIAAPLDYDHIMNKIQPGKLMTSEIIRSYLAKKHQADFTCQLTAGIFINIVANASEERKAAGDDSNPTPYWRTLKKDGELNEKYPGGLDNHKYLLEREGHTIINKGKKQYVLNYEKALQELE